MRTRSGLIAGWCALAAFPAAAPAQEPAPLGHPWKERIRQARSYAENREGRVAFAVVDERGRLRAGLRSGERYHSASVVKAMLMVAYLNRRGVRRRALREPDRDLLGPMIRRSDNSNASRVRNIVGYGALDLLARRARMRQFTTAPSWGDCRITASDTARLFARIDRLVVPRHRAYARTLLGSVVRSQRWGIPRVAPRSFRAFIKGGWRREGGRRLAHQGALLERTDGTRLSIAVLTDGNRSHGYGAGTVGAVARRLLRGLP